MEFGQVRVRWFGNNSRHYDGRVEDVRTDDIIEDQRQGLRVGNTVRVQWGDRMWTGEVLDLLKEPTTLALAFPLTRNAGKDLVHTPQDIHRSEGIYIAYLYIYLPIHLPILLAVAAMKVCTYVQ